MSCHRCLAPENTACITVQAKDVREGDYLDTTGEGRLPRVERGIHRIFLDAEVVCGEVTLHREGMLTMGVRHDRRVKVWRDARVADPRPIDMRTDRPFRNLTDVALAGKEGIAAELPIGSVWEVGPFTTDRDPVVVEIVGEPFTSGTNYSCAPEDAYAKGKKSWFVKTRVLYSPYDGSTDGGQPPHVLGALTPRMAAKAGLHNLVPPCACRPACCAAFDGFTGTRRETTLLGRLRDLEAQVESVSASRDDWMRKATQATQRRVDAEIKLKRIKDMIA